MNQIPQWPVLDLAALMNMLISAGIGLLAGFVGGWIGHIYAVQRDVNNRKWQELNYWRTVLDQYDREAQKITRPTIPLLYIYRDHQSGSPQSPPLEQRLMREGRAARQRVEKLAQELGIDPGLPDPTLPAQVSMRDFT